MNYTTKNIFYARGILFQEYIVSDTKTDEEEGLANQTLKSLIDENASYKVISDFLNENKNSNAVFNYSDPVLIYALRLNRNRAVKALLENGADIFCQKVNEPYESAVHYILRFLSNSTGKYFFKQLKPEHFERLKEARYPNGETFLHIAARYSTPYFVNLLLKKGFNPNLQNNDGETPLHWAAEFNTFDVVKSFFDESGSIKTDPCIKNRQGYNASNVTGDLKIHRYLGRQRYKYVLYLRLKTSFKDRLLEEQKKIVSLKADNFWRMFNFQYQQEKQKKR